jgi:hypothetical protein
MLWIVRRESSNVEDRRGSAPKLILGGGIGTIILALAIYKECQKTPRFQTRG